MGYAVLHLEKASGNDAGMSAHIERTVKPKNADESRTHLNKELIDFPEGVETRTQAVQQRIVNANITRKIGKNQVQAIRIMLSGTHEDMKDIEEFGNLNHWCKDNIDWLKQTFGADNLVSAVLHVDEKTPHIHATVVPIVTGERRKAQSQKETDPNKKKYRKKNTNLNRLCADDVMSRTKLKEYQNTYAEAMTKYGLQRGVEGSEAKHIGTATYYRELFVQNEILQKNVESLQHREKEGQQKVYDMYEHRDEVRGEFLSIDHQVSQKTQEFQTLEKRLEYARQNYTPYMAQEELDKVHELFPMMKEQLRVADLCVKVGIGIESVRQMYDSKTLTAATFRFYSPEHEQKFEAKDIRLKIEKESDNPNKLQLSINGMNILNWFREKYKEMKKAIEVNIKPENHLPKKGRGI